jgi:hypothetical protein
MARWVLVSDPAEMGARRKEVFGWRQDHRLFDSPFGTGFFAPHLWFHEIKNG